MGGGLEHRFLLPLVVRSRKRTLVKIWDVKSVQRKTDVSSGRAKKGPVVRGGGKTGLWKPSYLRETQTPELIREPQSSEG